METELAAQSEKWTYVNGLSRELSIVQSRDKRRLGSQSIRNPKIVGLLSFSRAELRNEREMGNKTQIGRFRRPD
jgi:hypothetical protein